MGTQCIGKVSHSHPRHVKSPSSHTSDGPSHLYQASPSSSQPLILPLPQPLPLYPLYNKFTPPSSWQFHQEYRYQDFSQQYLWAQSRMRQDNLSLNPKEQNVGWKICSLLAKEYWERAGLLGAVISCNSYVYDNKSRIESQIPQPNKFESYPDKLLHLTVSLKGVDNYESKSIIYEIQESKNIKQLITRCRQRHSEVRQVQSNLFCGFYCYSGSEVDSSMNSHVILQTLGIQVGVKMFALVLFPPLRQIQKLKAISNEDTLGLRTYWEISVWIKMNSLNLWSFPIIKLFKRVDPALLKVFLGIQILKHIIDRLEGWFFTQGLYLSQQKQLSDRRMKLVVDFLRFEGEVMKEFVFLSECFLNLSGLKDTNKFIEDMLSTIARQTILVSDGLFCELGLQINQKQHPFRNQPYHFLNPKDHNKPINILTKQTLTHQQTLSTELIKQIQLLCQAGQELTLQHIKTQHNLLMNRLELNFGGEMKKTQNCIVVQDYLMRVKTLAFFISFGRGHLDLQLWRDVNDHFGNIQLIATETAFTFLTMAALLQSANKDKYQNNQQEKKHYLRALQMGLKVFGDPRANHEGRVIESELFWFSYLLQNFSALHASQGDKVELNFLTNLNECAKIDLKNIIMTAQQYEKQQKMPYSLQILIKYMPIRKFSGRMIKRSQIWDIQKEASKSNFSQSSGSISGQKRLLKSSFRMNQWQFGLKLDKIEGVLQWGNYKANPPQTLPSLKNYQILAISSSNYHIIFVVEDGLYGWGQNHSGQLGKHNDQKVYKQVVKIQTFEINRTKDRFEISCGNQHSAMLFNGTLMMWGQSDQGIISGHAHKFDVISCGGLHTLGLRDGRVFSWGRGEGGQLGHPINCLRQNKKEETTLYFLDTPTQIKGLDRKIIKIACGDAHSLALSEDGKVFVFGFSYQGQLGLGLTGESQRVQVFEPVELQCLKVPVSAIWAGPTSSFFRTARGQVYSCGYNDCLQLGIDRVLKILQKKKYLHRVVDLSQKKMGEQQFSKPRKLDIFGEETGLQLLSLQCGENHSLAVAQYDGSQRVLVGWGYNRQFQLDFKIGEVSAARTLDLFNSVPIRMICCGSSYSLAVVGHIKCTHHEVRQKCLILTQHS